VREAVGIDGVFDGTHTVGPAQHGDDLCLHVRGKTRVFLCDDVGGLQSLRTTNAQGVARPLDLCAAPPQRGQDGVQVVRRAMCHRYVATCYRRRRDVGTRLDPIGNHPVMDRPQLFHSRYFQRRGFQSVDRHTRFLKRKPQIRDFGFEGRIADDRGAASQRRRHHRLRRSAHAGKRERYFCPR
jgi:hypothetical protein